MADDDKFDENQRGSDRAEVGAEVDLSFDDFQSFKVQYAENISVSGMYLRTSDALPVNTKLRFRFRIQDIDQEITGKAVVVWTKEVTAVGGAQQSGMGLSFLELEEGSEAFLKDFVEKYVEG